MAIELSIVPEVTPAAAATDLRTAQNKFVMWGAEGMNVANIASATGLTVAVLRTAPNSGEPATVALGPNVVRVIAGEAIKVGQVVQVMSAAGLAGLSSPASYTFIAGQAWSTAAGSGEFVSVKLK